MRRAATSFLRARTGHWIDDEHQTPAITGGRWQASGQ